MTRVTVYNGTPFNHTDDPEEVYDAFLNHEHSKPVRIETSGGQEIHIPGDEAVDIYIDGEEVEEE